MDPAALYQLALSQKTVVMVNEISPEGQQSEPANLNAGGREA